MNLFDPLIWASLLLLVGCALALLEVFLPSGGVLTLLSVSAVVGAIWMAFYHRGPAVGLTFAIVAVVALPLVVAVGFKYWPQTPMGKRILLGLPTEEEVLPVERKQQLQELVGKVGVATCPMLPSGAARIDGRVVDAVSQGMPIDKGQRVVVVEARAYRVVVRPAEEGEDGEQVASTDPNDVLSRPLDELGLEPLDDPLS